MKKIILFILGVSITFSLAAQHHVVYGKVNVFGNLALTNIIVSAKKAGTQTQTDSTGHFFIVCNERDVLEFKGATFYKEKRRIKPKTDSLNVQMRFISSSENVELAIGYGYISKDESTYAVSMLNNKQENFCMYSNIFDLIKGKCPGVNITEGSNFPGDEKKINIRGGHSINMYNSALYVVDGVVVPTISTISPCNVKSINFLKDASASIYGAEGAGGVVLIETIK